MQPKPTPGPWEAQILEHGAPYITARRHGDEIGHDCIASMNPQLNGAAQANALLMAAAPSMLEALKLVADLIDKSGTDRAVVVKGGWVDRSIRSAVQKAEGAHA